MKGPLPVYLGRCAAPGIGPRRPHLFARHPVRSSCTRRRRYRIGRGDAGGRLFQAHRFTYDKITEVDVVTNPERLRQLHLTVLDDSLR